MLARALKMRCKNKLCKSAKKNQRQCNVVLVFSQRRM